MRRGRLARGAWGAGHGGASPDDDCYSKPDRGKAVLIEIAGPPGASTSSASKFLRGLRVPVASPFVFVRLSRWLARPEQRRP